MIENSETLANVSVSTTFVQSLSVSVLTTPKFSSLDESQSRQLKSQLVLVSTNLEKLSPAKSQSQQLPYKNSDNLSLKSKARQGYQGTTIR